MSIRALIARVYFFRYTKHVTKELGRAELILKIILTPPSTLVPTYRSLLSNGTEVDFQKIMELKASKAFFHMKRTHVHLRLVGRRA